MLSTAQAATIITEQFAPAMVKEIEALDLIDRWWRWDHEEPNVALSSSTKEYRELGEQSQTPWGGLVITAVAQSLFVEGYRSAGAADNAGAWRWWQANRMDSRQTAIHRAALSYGRSYAVVLPGTDPLTGESMPSIRGVSPRRMVTMYADVAEDDWPEMAVKFRPTRSGNEQKMTVTVYDATHVYQFITEPDFTKAEAVGEPVGHEVGVCPVVRYANDIDLEGRTTGEIEPLISTFKRLDQTTFDRLVVQRFGAFVTRTISGMALPDQITDADGNVISNAQAEKLRLAADSILVAEDPDTKFGSLPATPLDGYLRAHESDIRDLAAVSQTPPHHLLGAVANLSAEALAAAESALSRKTDERRHSFGESHEATLRLAALIAGDTEGARDIESQVRWRDTESRSLAQAADALGKLAQMLGVPVELLWEKIPGFTDQDVERARELAAEGDALGRVLDELNAGETSATPSDAENESKDLKARADAMGVLIRAGVDQADAAEQAGLGGVSFVGSPSAVRLTEDEAAGLEGP